MPPAIICPSAPMFQNFILNASVTPVSYTHLDVYKRQALRRESAGRLLSEIHFAVIRGNASEIRGLAGETAAGSGVDAGVLDVVTEENLLSSLEMVRSFSQRTGSVIAVSGAIDIISDGNNAMALRGGCATMARITGSGCMLTTLIGAFCGAMPDDLYTAACAAMAAMNVCGCLLYTSRCV